MNLVPLIGQCFAQFCGQNATSTKCWVTNDPYTHSNKFGVGSLGLIGGLTPNFKPQTPNDFFASNNYFLIRRIPFIQLVQTRQMVNFSTMKKIILGLLFFPIATMAQRADDSVMIKKISDEVLRNG